eukprot:TRINITY_DN12166_c0_g1_i12.p1 TRINITY_DN12166_c0_g1~~TRINITY_DN12166_c0_g1_i12.p1  ORF type:complete len:737 (-),score=171.86 TRINITY_DN12166_c0_g1_i12:311-2521(-)
MDVAAFSDENFDPKDWINKALRSADSTQTKEAAASSLVLKLQLMISKLNGALEDQCQQVVHSIPRIVLEAEQLQQEATFLKDKLISVKADVESVEQETEQNMHALIQMDRVKERISETSKALQEADNWSILDSQAEEGFAAKDYALVGEKISGMQVSLRLLHHAADYQERVDHLESLRNRLEATLSPQLVKAFSNNDREAAEAIVNIFRGMERDKQLTKYYSKCVKARVAQKWSDFVNAPETDVGDWLNCLYTELLNLAKENQVWCTQVFTQENPSTMTCSIITGCLGGLDPSLEFCMEAAAKLHDSATLLPYLLSLTDRTDKFLADIETYLEGCTEKECRTLGKAVYAPYKQFVNKYRQLETQALTKEMEGWSSGGKDTIEEIHSLSSSVGKLVQLYESAGTRCALFTKGTGFPALAGAIRDSMDKHLDRYRKIMRRLEKRKGIADDDWSVLQHCLSAVQITGDLLNQFEELDMKLSLQLLEACRPYLTKDKAAKPLAQYHNFLLNSEDLTKLEALFGKVSGKSGSGSSAPLLKESLALVKQTSDELQKTSFNIMFHPVETQLDRVSELASKQGPGVSLEANLPEFSFSPQEYITQTGEYLMTLPQHLEPFMSGDTSLLGRALRDGTSIPGAKESAESADTAPVDFLLGCVAVSTCAKYLEQLNGIQNIGNNSARQLGIDIGYLGNVLEDLGHSLSPELSSACALLKVDPAQIKTEGANHPANIVALVKKIRSVQ